MLFLCRTGFVLRLPTVLNPFRRNNHDLRFPYRAFPILLHQQHHLHVFLHLAQVGPAKSFPALNISRTGYKFSRAYNQQDWLQLFLRLAPVGPVTSFPTLSTSRTGYMFSCSQHQQERLQVFPRLAPVRPVTSFTALGTSRTGFKFSCTWHQEDWLQFFLHLAPIAFLFLASAFFFFSVELIQSYSVSLFLGGTQESIKAPLLKQSNLPTTLRL